MIRLGFLVVNLTTMIYHARSDDLIKWEKDSPLQPIIVPDRRWYVPHNYGPLRERGCVAWTVSKDLKNWEVKPPLYNPFIGAALEVIEILKMEGRYLMLRAMPDPFRVGAIGAKPM